jgi:hypothetical protein
MKTFLFFILSIFMLGACSQQNLNVSFLESNKSFLPYLEFSTVAQTVSAGACSAPVTVNLFDSTGVPKVADVDLSFFLTATSTSLIFYSDMNCSIPMTSLPMVTGSSATTFYYQSSVSGMETIKISHPLIVGTSQLANITAASVTGLAFSPNFIKTNPNVCSTMPVQLRAVDSFANPGVPTTDINVSFTLLNAALYSDASCSIPVTTITLSTANPTKELYIMPNVTEGSFAEIATASGMTDGTFTMINYSPLTITASDNQLYLGQTQTYTSTGGGGFNNFTTTGGTISNGGLYTATTVGVFTVSVTDVLSNVASTSVTVRALPSLTPSNITIKAGQSASILAVNGFDPYSFNIAAGLGTYDSTTMVFTAPTVPSSSVLQMTDSKGTQATANITITAGDPAALTFNTSAQSVTTGLCSNAVEAGLVDQYGNPTSNSTGNTLTVTPIGAGMTFYSDSICSMPIANFNIAVGASTGMFFFKSQMPGISTLFINSPTLTMTTQTVSVVAATLSQLSYTPAILNMLAGECKQTILSTIDVYGNSGAPTSALSVAMTNTGNLSFYSDPSCTTVLNTPFTIDGANPTQTVYVRSEVASSSTNYASSSGLADAMLTTNISPEVASKLIFFTQPSTNATKAVVFTTQPKISITDLYGNVISNAANTITLSASPDPTCSTMASGTLTATVNPLNATNGYAYFAGVKYDTVQNLYLRADSSGLSRACSSKVSIEPDYSASLITGATTVPSDGLAYTKMLLIPRIDGVKIGPIGTIEIAVNSPSVTMTCAGGACTPCTTVSGTQCVRAEDNGHGAYSLTMKDSVAETVNFTIYHINGGVAYKMGEHIVTFDSMSFTTLNSSTTITSSYAGQNLYITGGTATFDATTNGVTFGHIFIRGGTVKHLATTVSVVNKLDIIASSLNVLSGGINATGLGYLYGSGTSYSFGATAPSLSLGSTGTGSTGAGGSHGGRGAIYSSYTSGITYDNYRNPEYPGGAGSVSASAGGGIIRIQSQNPCLIASGSTIKADGTENGAGGSIMLTCKGFVGDAAAGSITTNGGTPTVTTNTGGGGGGRTSLITTTDEAGFTESFRYPADATEMTNFNNRIQSRGGGLTGLCGGAGTIYLNHAGHTFGSMIVDNAGLVCKPTELPSIANVTTTIAGNTISISTSLSAGYANLYKGLRLRPDVSMNNGTDNPMDDNIVSIASNSLTSLTVTGDISGLVSTRVLRSIEIFDELYIGGGAIVSTGSDVVVINGSFVSNTLDLTNGALSLTNGAMSYPAVENLTLTAGTFAIATTYAKNLLIAGAVVNSTEAINAQNVTMNSGTFVASTLNVTNMFTQNSGTSNITYLYSKDFTLTGGTSILQTVVLTNDFLGTGGTLTHPAATTTNYFRLDMLVNGKFTLQGTAVDATSKGYLAGYSMGNSGVPSTILGATSASHGGQSGNGGITFGNYKYPEYPGGGSSGTSGGGAIKINAMGLCQIDSPSVIYAKSGDSASNSGAGGSINMRCAGFKGTAASGAINASAGTAGLLNYGGGGGRIALVSTGAAATFQGSFTLPTDNTSLSNFANIVQARGGAGSTTNPGAAGTIYVKHSGQSYGGLIVNNNSTASNGKTLLPYMHSYTTSAVTSGGSTFNFSITPIVVSLYKGLFIRPDIATINGTSTLLDDFRTQIQENATGSLTTVDVMPTQVSNKEFRTIEILDNLYVMTLSEVTSGADMVVTTGNFLGASISFPGTYTPLESAVYEHP